MASASERNLKARDNGRRNNSEAVERTVRQQGARNPS